MTLDKWIESTGGCRKAALILGVSANSLRSWRNKLRLPSPKYAAQMIRRSNGELDCNAIYGPIVEKAESEAA